MYATIREEGVVMTICGGEDRKRHVYTTTTNYLEIHLNAQNGEEGEVSYFLLQYEGIISFHYCAAINFAKLASSCSRLMY